MRSLDVRNSTQLAALAREFDAKTIDLLVHSAGVNRGTYDEQRLINAEAPFAVISSLMPAVMRSSRPRIAVLTSDLGTSARDNWRRRQACGDMSACDDFVRECKFVPICAYSLTKLSANNRLRALEPTWRARGVTAVALQPGHVRTDMNSGKGRISARESARGLRRVLDGLTPSSAGKFLDWRGRELPW